MGMGLSLTKDVVTEIKPGSQAARDVRITVGDRVVAVNGVTPTATKPPSTLLLSIGHGTAVTLELTRAALKSASKSAGLAATAPGLVVFARVEHAKHGHGTVQHIAGADDLTLKLTKVKVAFDSGQTHEYKGGSLDKLRVVQAAAERDSTVAVKIDPKRRPDPKVSAAPAPAPARPKVAAPKGWDKQPASVDPPGRKPEPKPELKVVELVRTPLGLGLTVDKQNKVIEITGGSQAERSGCFAVDDQVISLNGKLLSDKYSASFEQLLGTFAMGTKVILEISAPARETSAPKSKSFLKPAQPRQPGHRPSNMRSGSAVVAEERVLLEGRMSVRITGSPFHAQSVLKLTAAKASSGRKEPWTTFSYTSNHDTVAVPCRAIATVRMHPSHAQPGFEIEYVGPPEAEPQGRLGKKSLGRVFVRMRVWATSQEQFEEWRMALAPLPLTEGSAMDRARAWLEHRISELPVSEDDQNGYT